MCISGNIGAKIKIPLENIDANKYLFGEDQSRYLIEISRKNKGEVCGILEKNNIYYEIIGKTQEKNLDLNREFSIKIEDLNKLNSSWFKNYYKEK